MCLMAQQYIWRHLGLKFSPRYRSLARAVDSELARRRASERTQDRDPGEGQDRQSGGYSRQSVDVVAKLAAELLVEAVDAESETLDLVDKDFGKFDEYLDQVVKDFEQVCEHLGLDDDIKAESGLGKTGRWSRKDSQTAD